jgi:hypothetical protein
MDTNGKDTTVGNKRGGNAHHTLPHISTEWDLTAAVVVNTPPKQPKQAADDRPSAVTQTNLGHSFPGASPVAPVNLPNVFPSMDGLRRAEEAMLNVLLCQAASEQTKYNSSSSSKNYPGGQTTTTKLFRDHHTFLTVFPSYLCFRNYYCP